MITELVDLLDGWDEHEQPCHRDYAPLTWVWWTRGEDRVELVTGGGPTRIFHAVVQGVHHELDRAPDPVAALRDLLEAT